MQKLLGNNKEGLLFILSGPAGTGKNTLVKMLIDEFPCIVESVSFTTRQKRPDEVHGVHYHFVNDKEFEEKIAQNEFLEYVKLYGYYYGTNLNTVKMEQRKGKHVILVIDTQGALQLLKKIPAVFIFLQPPSIEVLRERLTLRQTEEQKVIEERLAWAKKELAVANQYDYCIVNDDLQIAYQILKSIFIAEEHRIKGVK